MTVPSRPAPALRIGIAGARSLAPDQVARLAAQVRTVLTLIRDALLAIDRQADAGPAIPRLISPLARGADRMAARSALDLG